MWRPKEPLGAQPVGEWQWRQRFRSPKNLLTVWHSLPSSGHNSYDKSQRFEEPPRGPE